MAFGTNGIERASDKFHLVEEFIYCYLKGKGGRQDPTRPNANQFTYDLLEVVERLLQYGFYATYDEVKEVAICLTDTLDGSKDYDGAKRKVKNDKGEDKDEDIPKSDRYKIDAAGNAIIMSSKQAIITCLGNITHLRDAYRQKCIMAYYKEARKTKN